MSGYPNPESNPIHALCRCYIASKAGGIIPPAIMDIHPVSGKCNNDCKWCVGRATRDSIEPLSNQLDEKMMIFILSKILDPRWRPLWPGEFHFCGSDSEPLLIGEQILPAIRYLLQRKRYVTLVTNGLLLNNDELLKIVSRIRELRISLDVSSDDDYLNYKLSEKSIDNYSAPYTTILNNIRKVCEYREKFKSNLKIKVSFVMTPKTFEREKWFSCLEELQKIGINSIRVRQDLTEKYGRVENLKDIVKEASDIFSELNIKYHAADVIFSHCNFLYCYGPRLWPTLAADGGLYPCAHTANSMFEPFANLMSSDSLMDLYQKIFYPPTKNHLVVAEIGCNRECPPMIGSFNDRNSAEKHLGKTFFV